jgi:hypothetical protein
MMLSPFAPEWIRVERFVTNVTFDGWALGSKQNVYQPPKGGQAIPSGLIPPGQSLKLTMKHKALAVQVLEQMSNWRAKYRLACTKTLVWPTVKTEFDSSGQADAGMQELSPDILGQDAGMIVLWAVSTASLATQ